MPQQQQQQQMRACPPGEVVPRAPSRSAWRGSASSRSAARVAETRPTSAAIQHVSAANTAPSPLPGSAAAITRIGSSRYGRASASAARATHAASPSVQAWTSGPPSAAGYSRRESLFSEDEPVGGATAPNVSHEAWAAFETSIKEIADDTLYFTQKQHRNFRSSDAFKQVLTDINYAPTVEVTAHDDDDVSLISFRPGSAAGDVTADGSIAPSAADAEWVERQSVLSIADDDCLSVSRASGLGRKSPGVHFRDRGGDYAASTVGRLSPAEEEPDEAAYEDKPCRTLLPVADIYTDPQDMRGELYQRYLHRPETWTAGLSRHLQKTVTRERLPASKVWHTTQIFRPKSAMVNGSRFDNAAVRFKRIQSAHGHLPSLRTHDQIRADPRRLAQIH